MMSQKSEDKYNLEQTVIVGEIGDSTPFVKGLASIISPTPKMVR